MFKLNGKEYKNFELDFNTICKLEEIGVNIADASSLSGLDAIRKIMSVAFDFDIHKAGVEIEEHIKNGGNFSEISEIVVKAIEDSGFIKALVAQTK